MVDPITISLWACAGLVAFSLILYKIGRRATERRIKEMERQLFLRGVLCNEIAHDIKNPITAILCSAETLELILGPKLEEDHRRSLRYIREYGNNLLHLVGDFLDLSLAEAGAVKPNPEQVNVPEICDSVSGLLKSYASKKHIAIHVEGASDRLITHFDPKHLKQVLFNLIHNAVKFTSEYGSITISISPAKQSKMLSMRVTDTGIGIRSDELPRVFDLYARVEHKDSKEPGTGVGLALCKTLVELGGGTISVESLPQRGTTFEVLLPAIDENAGKWDAHSRYEEILRKNSKPLTGQRILVVDEDQGTRESITTLLEALGGVVDQAGLAVDAIEELTKRSYDAVMIDHTVEGGAGYALAKIIRVDLNASETRIILAGQEAPDEGLAKEFGADACIEKPLNGETLLNSLTSEIKGPIPH